ncbi:helix-turn-helix domain-containing protein [Bizionia paragorgiae]|uniref:DNA binding domain-containing protein, excisionase family n=1 Tax=Bizionia paragorgiae TaxID=283786 RepID=A0A1H4AUA3_BIZPA|nr:helix-turn-helix domain-containing protein [Bizionia paragorgiae]SEA39357.1 DNA binding domain-containing protein, excisionase family [Bizionia paragorgiae]
MTKQILQIENTNNEDFKNEILLGLEHLLSQYEKNTQNSEKLLTREETAKLLSISLVTLWKYTKNDIIPAFRIGTKVRYKQSDVYNALQKMNEFD